jgi:hypothetical protein
VHRKTAPAASAPPPNGQPGPEDAQKPGQPPEDRIDLIDFEIAGQEAPTAANEIADAAPNPFAPGSLRLAPGLMVGGGANREPGTIKVGKPEPSWWVRTHPAEEYRLMTAVLEIKGSNSNAGVDVYPIVQPLQEKLAYDPCFRLCLLTLAVTRQGDPFVWRVNMPREGGRSNDWSRSALEAVERARTAWIRTAANMRTGGYDLWVATGPLPEPVWPDKSFEEILVIAFRNNFIRSLDDPIVRGLHGE